MNGNWKFLAVGILFSVGLLTATYGQRSISGTVTDTENGEPIPGANVFKKGTTTGTITNLNGFYSLEVNEGDILVFSFIGYATQEVPITDQVELNIQLQAEITELDEIIVVGYGKMRIRANFLEEQKKSVTVTIV